MGLLSYYCLVVVFVIGIVIYDLLFYTKYKNDVCPEIVPTPAEDLARRLLEPQIDYRLHVHFLEDRILQDEAADENADEAAADENADEAAADENADEAGAGSTSGSGLSSNILVHHLTYLDYHDHYYNFCLLRNHRAHYTGYAKYLLFQRYVQRALWQFE